MARPLALLVTTAGAARRLGISRERVRQLLEGGLLTGFRIEGSERSRFVDLSGEGSESDRVLVTAQGGAQQLWSVFWFCGGGLLLSTNPEHGTRGNAQNPYATRVVRVFRVFHLFRGRDVPP